MEKKLIIIFDAVIGNYMQNAFMHAADVFEPGKILGEYQQFEVSFSVKENDVKGVLQNITEKMKNSLENENLKQSRKIVSFLSIRTINGEKNIDILPYIKRVQTISDGSKFCLLSKILTSIGYEVETSEHMHVLTAKLK